MSSNDSPSRPASSARPQGEGFSVSLSSLAAVTGTLRGDGATPVTDIAYDSRAVTPGALYLCVPGAHSDGHDFARDAVAAGAAAVVVERPLGVTVPQLTVPSVRAAMGPLAAEFFAHPSRTLQVVGVTGTNGKTTTTFLLESVWRAMGVVPGMIGTVETHIGDEVLPVKRTTPEAVDLQRLLARMRASGVRAVAMETSSEGLAFARVEGTRFSCGIFTNLTQDHLNTHGTMDAYFEAKMLLFRPSMCSHAVINVGDPWGARAASLVRIPLITFALGAPADVRATSIAMDAAGSTVVADVRGERFEFRVPLAARYNVENALGVVAACAALSIPLDIVARGIAALRGVPGRLERVDAGQDFTVLVDYAHTPDSLEGVLRAARELVPSGARLISVFGCGGDRDRAKRPLMGRAGVAFADRAIITSDNPRTENPDSIIEMIAVGARETGKPFEIEPDRRAAIARALEGARAGDVIVIAGKGHESGQEFADHTIAFDDRAVARELLEAR